MTRATARAGSNIAFIKYWGVADAAINLPLTNSISMTLDHAYTTTTVEWAPRSALPDDEITLDGTRLDERASRRLIDHLDRLRALAGVDDRASVVSANNFPMASGIASSASGFAALTFAGCKALGLDLDASALSAVARRGSGSACRSLFGGFVEWNRGWDHASSVASELFPADHWLLVDLVAIVSRAAKATSSEQGHRYAASSPLNAARVENVHRILPPVREAIAARDLAALGPLIEQDALCMHAVMMTGSPGLFYWSPATIEIMAEVRSWRAQDGICVWFTIDAGPNVHVLCERADAEEVQARLRAIPSVETVLTNGPGPGPALVDE